jgi:potassium/chloride transporter 9
MADADHSAQTIRRLPTRTRSNFATRTARDENERLHRRSFAQQPSPQDENTPLLADAVTNTPEMQSYAASMRDWLNSTIRVPGSHPGKPSIPHGSRQRPGAVPRPVGGVGKLGTFAGVFVPVTLNVLSILMFLRFGFILGQAGLVGIMGMLVAGYLINLLTTMSISAIATNGTVRGGGAYYLISIELCCFWTQTSRSLCYTCLCSSCI